MSHTITQWKLQILHSFSKHLVFIQTLLPFHTAGYFSLKGNSCPINKGWWEGAWGRLFRMQEAFPCVLQLRAGEHQGRDGPWHIVGTRCASEPHGTWPLLGQPQLGAGHSTRARDQGNSPAAPWGPAVPVGQGLAGSWCRMQMSWCPAREMPPVGVSSGARLEGGFQLPHDGLFTRARLLLGCVGSCQHDLVLRQRPELSQLLCVCLFASCAPFFPLEGLDAAGSVSHSQAPGAGAGMLCQQDLSPALTVEGWDGFGGSARQGRGESRELHDL